MDNYITPAAQAVGRSVQTAAPYAENIAGLLASIPLAAYEIGQPGGSPMQFLANRQAMLQDPGFRSMAGPFLSGLMDVTGGTQPQALPPGQAGPPGPPVWQPNLPPPSPERQLQSETARAALQLFPQLTQQQQAETLFGVKPHFEPPADWIPKQMNTGTGGVTFVNPNLQAQGGELHPAMAGGQPVPGLFQTPRGGFIRDPRFSTASGGEGKEFLTQSREFDPRRVQAIAAGTLRATDMTQQQARDYLNAQRQMAAQTAAEKQRETQAVRDYALTNTTKVMKERAPTVKYLANRVLKLLEKVRTGPAAGRFQEFMTTDIGLRNPEYRRLRTDLGLLTSAITQMHVGNRAVQAIAEKFNKDIGESSQDPDNLRASLDEVLQYADEVASRRSGPLAAEGGVGGSRAGVTASGNKYSIGGPE